MIKANSTPLILNGRTVRDEVLKNIKSEINQIKLENKRLPGLAVVLVGEAPASYTYVKNKEKKCTELGIYSEVHRLPGNTSENELTQLIKSLNKKKNIDGILLQLPLPAHIKSEKVIEVIDPKKDIDGLHPHNLGKLLSGQWCLKPCTPQGIIEILKHYSINISGASTVVLGRSILVGKPLSLLLLRENATVTIAHSKTKNIEEVTSSADILICAVGKPRLVKKSWVKPGATVIDVGISKINTNENTEITGDVDFEEVKSVCGAITPVPGGVGPVTIAMLIKNTMEAYKENREKI